MHEHVVHEDVVHEHVVHEHELQKRNVAAARVVLRGGFAQRRMKRWTRDNFLQGMEDATMPRVKQASKKKRGTKTVPVLGAAGLTFSLVGGASAAVAPITDVPQTPNIAPGHAITLGEEEIADVSLATFYVFDKENTGATQSGVQVAWRGCGGCRGCRGCRACRGCGGCRGCGVGGCCASWGACRFC
jgi:hypothetical protein